MCGYVLIGSWVLPFQVHHPYSGTPGCVVLRDAPLLVLAGDAFVRMSHFDGCVDSALAVKNALHARFSLAASRRQ